MITPPDAKRVARSCLIISLSALWTFPFSSITFGQSGAFRAGQRILWMDGISGKWEEGRFVGETPGGSQPLIQRKPGDPHSQIAYSWDRVKPWAQADGVTSTTGATPVPAQPPAPSGAADPTPLLAAESLAGPPLTEAEILKFITDRIGNTPFADSAKLQQTKNSLAVLIKKRGTAFLHDSAISPFGQQISALGMTSEVTGPLGHNFGPPNPLEWLFGSWVTSKTGLPVRYIEGDKIITWLEIGAANTGVVTLNAKGTYVWDTDSAQGILRGKWHVASDAEMGDQGGAGVVLENAKNGVAWVAYKYRAGNPREEWLGLAEVNHRSIREGGQRIPPGQEARVKVRKAK